jgi:hypothetical protein
MLIAYFSYWTANASLCRGPLYFAEGTELYAEGMYMDALSALYDLSFEQQ